MGMEINKIDIERGGSLIEVVLPNKDRLDSVATFFHDKIKIISSDTVNTDPSTSWAGKGGIIAESILQPKPLWFIYGPRPTGVNVVHIFTGDQKRFEQIKKVTDLTLADVTVRSLIPNPTQNNQFIMTFVQMHAILRNKSGDASEGCFSTDLWQAISSYFCVGDKGSFSLFRKPGWDAPDTYALPNGMKI